MAISKRLRYEILRRDNYACRYCGASAPGVKLTVDHVVPVALGGTDEATNLATSCGPCNAGKSSAAPDAALVADVNADALRWTRALKVAGERMTRASVNLAVDVDNVIGMFEDTHRSIYGKTPPLPPDAAEAIRTWITRGLPAGLLGRLADQIGSSALPNIPWEARWRYFAGACWKTLRNIEVEARRLIEAGEF